MESRKGFTLAELLIVVAIIGILIAVSIPVFIYQLDHAKQVTCSANRRSLKGEVLIAYTSGEYETCAEAYQAISAKDQDLCPSEGSWTPVYHDGILTEIQCSEHPEENEESASETFISNFYTLYAQAKKSGTLHGGDAYREYFNTNYFKTATVSFSGDTKTYKFSFNSDYSGSLGLLFANDYTDWHYKQYAQYIYNPQDSKWYHCKDAAGVSTEDIASRSEKYNSFLKQLSSNSQWESVSSASISS
jgi:prepilin-type N-terminal cleavage/methylation domain-containing protein